MSESKGRKTLKVETEASNPPKPYEVDMTASAEAVYVELYRKSKEAEKRGDYSSNHCTTFRMVREAIREIIPKDPFAKQHALRGEFANMFRLRKGRMRIIWIASSRIRKICIMLISETLRKEGDMHDPYVILSGLVAAGKFDELFNRYGVRMQNLANPGMA
jgi:hypothetical protein